MVVTDYYDDGVVDNGDLSVGDVITHIDNKSVDDMVDSLLEYYPASNRPTKLRNISSDMLRSDKQSMKIQYLSSGQRYSVDMTLYQNSRYNVSGWYKSKSDACEKCYKILDGNIGYVTLSTIREEDISAIRQDFANTKGIIIDIRNFRPLMSYSHWGRFSFRRILHLQSSLSAVSIIPGSSLLRKI